MMHYLKKILKLVFYILTGVFILFLILVIFVAPYFVSFRISKEELAKKFEDLEQKPALHDDSIQGRNMHYAEIGENDKPVIVFVHGSPGSWSAWVDFFKNKKLLSMVKMVAIDRPGFGDSEYGNTETSLEKQAAFLQPILEKYKNKHPMILIGHSLGGPLIARIAMDYPQLADGLIFVAPSIDPDLEEVMWYQWFANWPVIRSLIPASIKVSNQEILPLADELRKMLPFWKNIKIPCVFIHGTKDSLVPVGNADFAKKMLTHAEVQYVIVEGMDHFVPWTNPELILDGIDHLLEKKK